LVPINDLANFLRAQIEGFNDYSISADELARWALQTDSDLPFLINAPVDMAGYILFLEEITESEDELHRCELQNEPCPFLAKMLDVLDGKSVAEHKLHYEGQIFSDCPEDTVCGELIRKSGIVEFDRKNSYTCDFTLKVWKQKTSIEEVIIEPL
jgi:hypothetical protein